MTKLNFIIDAQYKAGRALGRAEKDIDKLDKKAKKTTGKAGGMGGLGGLAAMLGGPLAIAAGAATAAIGALATGIVASTNKAADLEAQMGGIAAVMGKTKDEVAPLKDLILKLGIDPKLKVSATEAANAVEMLGRNGLTMSQIMEGAARNTVLLANATGADFATAADISTDVMSLFNIEAKDMGQAVNGITSVVNNSKFSIDDYRLAMAQGGGVAATVGMTFDDFNATIAGIAPLFASGSDAGTSLKTMLMRLVPQSNEAADKMRALGLFSGLTEKEFEKLSGKIDKQRDKIRQLNPESKNYQENLDKLTVELKSMESQLVKGNNAFFDQEGNMKSMTEISKLLSIATSGLSDEQRNSALSTIFGSDAMRAAAGVAELGKGKFADLKRTMGDTSAEDAAKTRVDNLRGSMDILSGIVEALQLRIGEKFIPVIRKMVDAFAAFLDNHADRIVGFFDKLATKTAAAIDWIGKLVGAGENELPKLENIGRQSIEGLTKSINGIADVSPVAIDAMADMIVGMVDWVAESGVPMLADAIMDFPSIVADAFSGDGPETPAGKLLNAITMAFAKIQVSLVEASARIAWSIVRGIINGFGEKGQELTASVEQLAEKAWTAFKNWLGIASPSTKFYELGIAVVDGFVNAINDRWQGIVIHVGSLAQSIADGFGGGLGAGRFASFAHDALQGLIDKVNQRSDEIRSHFHSVASSMVDSFKGPFNYDTLKDRGRDIMNGLKDGVSSRIDSVRQTIQDAANSIKDTFDDWFDFGSPSKVTTQMGKWIMEGLEKGINAGTGDVLAAVNLSLDAVAGQASSIINNNTRANNTTFNVSLPSPAATGSDMGIDIQAARLVDSLTAVAG